MDDTGAVLKEVEKAAEDITDRNHGLEQDSYEDTKEDRDRRAELISMVESLDDVVEDDMQLT